MTAYCKSLFAIVTGLALFAAPIGSAAQAVPPVPGQTPAAPSSAGPPSPLSVPSPNIERSRSAPASHTRVSNEHLTPQQRALMQRKLAEVKTGMKELEQRAKADLLAKEAQWQHREIVRRIALWQAIEPRARGLVRGEIQSQVAYLNGIDKQVRTLRGPVPTDRVFAVRSSRSLMRAWHVIVPGSPIEGPPAGGQAQSQSTNSGCTPPQITAVTVNQGQPGDPVVISGSGFGGNGQVYFVVAPGTVKTAPIDSWNDTEIYTSVPGQDGGIPSSYQGVVWVETCAKSSPVSFEFHPEIVVQQLPITGKDVLYSNDCNTLCQVCDQSNSWQAQCSTPGSAYEAITAGLVTGSRGDDRFFTGRLLLGGWTLDSVDLVSQSDRQNGNVVAAAAIHTANAFVDIHHWVDPPFGSESYALLVYIRGPLNVPYQ